MDMRILVEQNVGERLKKGGLAQEEFASFRDSVSNISTALRPPSISPAAKAHVTALAAERNRAA